MQDDFDNLLQSEALNIAQRGNQDLIFGGTSVEEFSALSDSINSTVAPLLTSGLAGISAANLATQQDRNTRFNRLDELRQTRQRNVQLDQAQQGIDLNSRQLTINDENTDAALDQRIQEAIDANDRNAANNRTSVRNNRANNATSRSNNRVTNETSRSNNRATNNTNIAINEVRDRFNRDQVRLPAEATEISQGLIAGLRNEELQFNANPNSTTPAQRLFARRQAFSSLLEADTLRPSGITTITDANVISFTELQREAIISGDFSRLDSFIRQTLDNSGLVRANLINPENFSTSQGGSRRGGAASVTAPSVNDIAGRRPASPSSGAINRSNPNN